MTLSYSSTHGLSIRDGIVLILINKKVTMKKFPLTKEEFKEVELLNSLSYDDIVEYVKNKPITESKDNVIKDLDLTY